MCSDALSGELSPLQLRKILSRFGVDMPDDLWSTVLTKLDEDSDGMVQIGEFMKQMKNAVADVKVGILLVHVTCLPVVLSATRFSGSICDWLIPEYTLQGIAGDGIASVS